MGGERRWGWALLVAVFILVLAMPHVGAETRSSPTKAEGGPVEAAGIAQVSDVAVGLRHFVALLVATSIPQVCR